MEAQAIPMHADAVAARPVSELLACPPDTGRLLARNTETLDFQSGQIIFAQSSPCRGLYLIIAGQLVRRAERRDKQVTLGSARPGDLIELAATLGDRFHSYSLVAQTGGSLLLLPMSSLDQAFQDYPPMRMRLLEELAREVSRGYRSCTLSFQVRRRRQTGSPARSQ